MEECEQLNLRRLEGNYLKFMVENHAELSLLEHVENCIQCWEYIGKLVEIDGHSTDFGNLFHRKSNDSSSPQFTDYNDPNDFIDARIKWRKRQLIRLNTSAELELEDLQKQISS